MLLGVNIDHVATLRQARYALLPDSPNAEPSVLQAARDAVAGGADSITIHVRGDRRHMQDRDAFELHEKIEVPLNLELGVTPEMLRFAQRVRPDYACMVPEKREEVTTEGGLDVAARESEVGEAAHRLQDAGIRVSLFIDPDLPQVQAAARCGAEMIELHTGAFANTFGANREKEVERLVNAAVTAHGLGLQVNAGHGLNYQNLPDLFAVPHLAELNIGHTIVSRAIQVGIQRAVEEMVELMKGYPE